MPEDEVKKIRELLESFDTAMLVTQGEDFPFHARPMAMAWVDPNCDVWFFTGSGSAKVDEIQHDQHVLVVCQNETGRYVTLRGHARLVRDRARIAELWREGYRNWFPKGPLDPELMLIHVKAQDAEYWTNEGLQSIRYLFEAAKAYARGTAPHVPDSEQHGSVSFTE